MAIKIIIPPDAPNELTFTTVGKMVQVVVDKKSGTIEWQPMNAQLKKGEAEYIAKRLKVKGAIPVERYQNIKAAICEGLKLIEIERRYRGRKGYTISEIKRVSAPLSDFNNWNRSPLVSKIK